MSRRAAVLAEIPAFSESRNPDVLPDLVQHSSRHAAELVRLDVDVIVTGANPVIAAVMQAATTIPVVMATSRDPVG